MLFLMLICLFPVALYLAVLAAINRRQRPLMLSGTWDFVGALLASAGFLLIAGPAILASFLSQPARGMLLRLDGRELPRLLEHLGATGVGPWLVYYGGMTILIAALLWWRRTRTVIYNVDPDQLEQLLHEVLERRGLSAFASRVQPQTAPNGEPPSMPRWPNHAEESLVQLERFDSMYHVTLHWDAAAGPLRRDVEDELARALRATITPENPAAGWLLGISTGLFGILTVAALVVIIASLLMARH